MHILTGHPVFLFSKSDSPTYRNPVRFYEIVSLNLGLANANLLAGVGACTGRRSKGKRLDWKTGAQALSPVPAAACVKQDEALHLPEP